jgi:hypothetical protein
MKHIAERLYDLFLGCPHANVSRPFTIDSRTYCVCCDCGREFAYSLKTMSIVGVRERTGEFPGLAVQHSQ